MSVKKPFRVAVMRIAEIISRGEDVTEKFPPENTPETVQALVYQVARLQKAIGKPVPEFTTWEAARRVILDEAAGMVARMAFDFEREPKVETVEYNRAIAAVAEALRSSIPLRFPRKDVVEGPPKVPASWPKFLSDELCDIGARAALAVPYVRNRGAAEHSRLQMSHAWAAIIASVSGESVELAGVIHDPEPKRDLVDEKFEAIAEQMQPEAEAFQEAQAEQPVAEPKPAQEKPAEDSPETVRRRRFFDNLEEGKVRRRLSEVLERSSPFAGAGRIREDNSFTALSSLLDTVASLADLGPTPGCDCSACTDKRMEKLVINKGAPTSFTSDFIPVEAAKRVKVYGGEELDVPEWAKFLRFERGKMKFYRTTEEASQPSAEDLDAAAAEAAAKESTKDPEQQTAEELEKDSETVTLHPKEWVLAWGEHTPVYVRFDGGLASQAKDAMRFEYESQAQSFVDDMREKPYAFAPVLAPL